MVDQQNQDDLLRTVQHVRQNLANPQFLLDHVYSSDQSQFAGSSHKLLVRAAMPEDLDVLDALRTQLSLPAPGYPWLNSVLERYAERLPGEIRTLVEAPASTSPEDCLALLQGLGQEALASSLLAHTHYAWLHAKLGQGLPPDLRRYAESSAWVGDGLLTNYHAISVAKARRSWPEIWDTAAGDLIFDSRGVAFARTMIGELSARGHLTSGTRLLDIGSGIGTVPLAAARWSTAQALGIEIHPGLAGLASSIRRRLARQGVAQADRVTLHQGDFRRLPHLTASADVIYVYSPLGASEINIDQVVSGMKVGGLLITERLPHQQLSRVSFEPKLASLFAMRRIG